MSINAGHRRRSTGDAQPMGSPPAWYAAVPDFFRGLVHRKSKETGAAFVVAAVILFICYFVTGAGSAPSSPASSRQTTTELATVCPPQTLAGLASFSSPNCGVFNVDSEFGALGAPRCRSKTGKSVKWTRKDLLKGLEDFVPIYKTRPITDSSVMGFDHSFGLWFIARQLQPKVMIDFSGFRGHSTWILRQAMPESLMIVLTPDDPGKFARMGPYYTDGHCFYLTGHGYKDFTSFSWNAILENFGVSDLSQVLLLFDDHQNKLRRIKQAVSHGFRHIVFDDNDDTGTGDNYSLRQICDQFYIKGGGHSCLNFSDEARIRAKRKRLWEKAVDINELCGPGEAWWGVKGVMKDISNSSNIPITLSEHFGNSRYVESVLELYWEVPPVAGPSLTHQTRYDPARVSQPIISGGDLSEFKRLGLDKLDHSVFNKYNQMVYVEVSPAS